MLSMVGEAPAAGANFDWVSQLVTWGPGGVVLALLLLGVLEPKRAVTKAEAHTAKAAEEAAHWRVAFEGEQAAHQRTREALSAANERASVAVEAGRTTAMLLTQRGHPVEGQDRSPG